MQKTLCIMFVMVLENEVANGNSVSKGSAEISEKCSVLLVSAFLVDHRDLDRSDESH